MILFCAGILTGLYAPGLVAWLLDSEGREQRRLLRSARQRLDDLLDELPAKDGHGATTTQGDQGNGLGV